MRRLLARRGVRVVLALLAVFAGWLSWSLGCALAAPGDDSVAARVAEWGRDHQLGPVVTALEKLQYEAHPPAVGGRPDMALVPAGGAAPGSGAKPAIPAVMPPRLASPAGPPLPGEGTWQVLGSVHGTPALYGAYVRPDADHTSYVAGWSPWTSGCCGSRCTRASRTPGRAPGRAAVHPGRPAHRSDGHLQRRLQGRRGPRRLLPERVTRGTLTDDDASLLYYRTRVAVGAWGRDVTMTPQVVGVRQNLNLIVDNGKVPDGRQQRRERLGLTIAGNYFVWRSGAGVTRDGAPSTSTARRCPCAPWPTCSSGGLCPGHATGHQPGLDVLHVLQADAGSGQPHAGEAAPHPGAPGRPVTTISRDFTAVYAR
ncbi:hypothetical protein GXW82_06865 [Streptacidiphilus sp. 4-A2]|nr:hypothetical protein [Streptacidiphilus sp. 4-A2]